MQQEEQHRRCSIDTNLLVQIFVPTSDGKGKVGTGYPVAPGRILTARHVLFPDNRDHDRPIEVRWYYQDGRLRDWKEVKKIHWCGDGEIDVAVIECLFPLGAEGHGLLNPAKPKNYDPWEGAGFAIAGNKNNERSPAVGLGGKVIWVADNEWEFQLGENYPARHAFLWKGASGGPVFSGNGIIGVIVSAPNAFGGNRFNAISIWKLLSFAGFAESIRVRGQRAIDFPITRSLFFLSSLVKTDAQTEQIEQLIPDRSQSSVRKAIACVFSDFHVECPDTLGFKLIHQLGSDQEVAEQLTIPCDYLRSRKAEEVLWESVGNTLSVKSATEKGIKEALQNAEFSRVFVLDLDCRQVKNQAWITNMAEAWERLTFNGKGHHHCLILLHAKQDKARWWHSRWLKNWVIGMQDKLSQSGRVIKPDPTPALHKKHLYAWINKLHGLGRDQQLELTLRIDTRFKANKFQTYLDIRTGIQDDLQAVLSQSVYSGSSS